ncbi:MBL fold metallo-hydrolase [Nocardioides phosphati]|uniref:MBL fold metallo-hydrolase n=1 Tax=Nocardioides phosphati TaxID=1867775 RepID=A0ABQ2ND27_9ACTN|nr:MBL fold metallo-hydrolase [Nocardioides phosphati]GGO93392.1 MBL fold metallo-hydrolase [Nocardioides phosphati]
MKVTVIGCAGSYPGPEAPASCYLVESEDQAGRTWRILLDLGSGALGELHNHVDPLTIDAVFVSHLHADHCLDLCGYYVMRKYHPTGPAPRIPCWGPHDTDRRMAKAYDLDEDPGMNEEFEFLVYDGPVAFGPFTVTAIPVLHPVEAYALRVEADDRVLVYSGDTDVCDSLVDAARDADLFLAEAAFRECDENPPGIHMTGRQAAEVALKAGVDTLVLTHIPAWHDTCTAVAEAQEVWSGPLHLATKGAVYEV